MTVPFRILLVEDDEDLRHSLAEALRDDGYAVDLACDGIEALEYLRAGGTPDVILLDLMMPRLDGYSFRITQMADTKINHFPVILLSADGRMDEVAESLDVSGTVGKPINWQHLIVTIENVRSRKDYDDRR